MNNSILLIKFKTTPVNMVVIQVYFLTPNSDDKEVEQVYDSLELLRITQDNDNVIIVGDFYAVVR